MSSRDIKRWWLVACWVGLIVCRAFGQPATTSTLAGAPKDETSEHAALRALVPIYEQAVNDRKPELLEPYLDPSFSGVMVTGESVESFASLQDYWKKIQDMLGPDGTYHVKVNVPAGAMLHGDWAVARGTTEDIVNPKGREYRFNSTWTAVCQKTDGQWKLLRIQSTMDPVTNAFVNAALLRTSVITGTIAGSIGVVVGVIVCIVIGNARAAKRRKSAA